MQPILDTAMPPDILQNAVDQIAAKMKETIPSAVLEKTAEQLRILETRVKTGTLGKYDRQLTRAAVLLELNFRQAASESGKLPWESLAAAAGSKGANLQQLQQLIGNYMQQPSRQARKSIPMQSTSTSTLSSSPRKRPHTAPYRTLRTGIAHRSDDTESSSHQRLAELSIRLAQRLNDPHGACLAARHLLSAMTQAINSHSSVHERRGRLYDLQRYRPAYEAAALFFVTTRGTSVVSGKRKVRDDDDSDEVASEQRPMDLNDLVDASTHFTYLELKQVLPNVVEMARLMSTDKKTNMDFFAEMQAGKSVPKKNTTGSVRVDAELLLQSSDDPGAQPHDDDDDVGIFRDEMAASTRRLLLQWQVEILSDACTRARQSLSIDESCSESKALQKAADDVLQKFGVVSDQQVLVYID
jgi:hypothetical protein